jgi:7-cyano-7-deazaguanine reductase
MKRLQKKRYDSLTLLGNTQVTFPASPADAKLETFTNRSKHRNYFIRINSHEFTSLCPVTGQPDFAEISVEYVPNELCLETKSLKLYLSSYRNVPSFNEDVVNRILDDLVKACQPRHMRIKGEFRSRGGLALSVTAEHPDRIDGSRHQTT